MPERFPGIETLNYNKYGVMIDYFNNINDSKFLDVVRTLANNCGYSLEYFRCSLASARHPIEEVEFEGDVRFVNATGRSGEQSLIVDYSTFYKYLSMACEDYLTRNHNEKDRIEEALTAIRQRYNI